MVHICYISHTFENKKYVLKIGKLTKEQRSHLIEMCDNAIKDYEDKIGLKRNFEWMKINNKLNF